MEYPVQEHHGRSAHVHLAVNEDLLPLEPIEGRSYRIKVGLRRCSKGDRHVDELDTLLGEDGWFLLHGVCNGSWRKVDDGFKALGPQSPKRFSCWLTRSDKSGVDNHNIWGVQRLGRSEARSKQACTQYQKRGKAETRDEPDHSSVPKIHQSPVGAMRKSCTDSVASSLQRHGAFPRFSRLVDRSRRKMGKVPRTDRSSRCESQVPCHSTSAA